MAKTLAKKAKKESPEAQWAQATSATRMTKLVVASFDGMKPSLAENRRRMALSALACLRVVWDALPPACRAAVQHAEDIWTGDAAACGLEKDIRAELERSRKDVSALRTVADVPGAVVAACEAVLAATARDICEPERWRAAVRLSGRLGAGGRGGSEATRAQKAARARAMRLVWNVRMGPLSAPDVPRFAGESAATAAGTAKAAMGPDADVLARLALADRLEEEGYADPDELGFLRDGQPLWRGSWLAERLAALAG